MSVKGVKSRLETFSAKLWREAINLEKLAEAADELGARVEDIRLHRDIEFAAAADTQRATAKRLREISFKLSGLDSEIQEMAWSIDEITDRLDELASPSGR
jgi:methyl-accepting chemotaxis protein